MAGGAKEATVFPSAARAKSSRAERESSVSEARKKSPERSENQVRAKRERSLPERSENQVRAQRANHGRKGRPTSSGAREVFVERVVESRENSSAAGKIPSRPSEDGREAPFYEGSFEDVRRARRHHSFDHAIVSTRARIAPEMSSA